MVNEKDFSDEEIDITEEEHHDFEDIELSEEEATGADKLKQLRQKLKICDEEKRSILEEAQREKADFLNARRRLEAERVQDKLRHTKKHVEAILPLCDSFEMAMGDKNAWEKADENWRKGIEGIYAQLTSLLNGYNVSVINPINEPFDPYKHEAIGTQEVSDKGLDEKVVSVLQCGYEIKMDDKVELIRPARVTIGTYKN